MFDLNYFKKISNSKDLFIAGCDEVGRGPLAGPVVAACAQLHQKKFNEQEFIEIIEFLKILGVSDSKKIPNQKREEIITDLELQLINDQILTILISKNSKLQICVQEISVDIIDEINILNASLMAMKKSFETLYIDDQTGIVLIDGNKVFQTNELSYSLVPIIKGDSKSVLIGLASIAAKVYRDRLMSKYSEIYPGYSWEQNAGYGTLKHLEAIKAIGITPIHRKTFKGVKEFYEKGRQE